MSWLLTAIQYLIARLERKEAQHSDVEILNRRADTLNAEAEDVLGYQVTP